MAEPCFGRILVGASVVAEVGTKPGQAVSAAPNASSLASDSSLASSSVCAPSSTFTSTASPSSSSSCSSSSSLASDLKLLELLWANEGLSFWGGVDPETGVVIDSRHPLLGQQLSGKALAIPSGRGSCTGSSVLLQLILNGLAPEVILLRDVDEILCLGALVAKELFHHAAPTLIHLGPRGFSQLEGFDSCLVDLQCGLVQPGTSMENLTGSDLCPTQKATTRKELVLGKLDQEMLAGKVGHAAQVSARVVQQMAQLQGAETLVDVSTVHIDASIYTGPASLLFAQKLEAMGGKVRVPTTLNAISVDKRRWMQLGIPAELGTPASALADSLTNLGASPTFTCAPYLLEDAPKLGEQVSWAESNAVIFANSVLGARTQKYADFLDVFISLTGRAPYVGPHLDAGRRASLVLQLPEDISKVQSEIDDSFWEVLGYLAGLKSGKRIPVITGVHGLNPTRDNLKALCGSFGTTSASPMLHVEGVTPEAPTVEAALSIGSPADRSRVETIEISLGDLEAAFNTLDSAAAAASASPSSSSASVSVSVSNSSSSSSSSVSSSAVVGLVALGSPHLSLTEVARLSELCADRKRHESISFVLTLGRSVMAKAEEAGHIQPLNDFGATILNDTCWCMLTEPVVPPQSTTLLTNSAKYAHYAPGLVNRQVRFRSLAGCVEAAVRGEVPPEKPGWLRPQQLRSFSTTRLQRLARRAFRR